MIRLRHKLLIQGFRLFDQILVFCCLAAAGEWLPLLTGNGSPIGIFKRSYDASDAIGIALLIIGWNVTFNAFVRYNANRFNTLVSQLIDLIKATTAASFWLMLVASVASFDRISVTMIVMFWTMVTVLGVLSRVFIRWFLMTIRAFGYNYRYLLIVGTNLRSRTMAARIDASPELGYKIVGFISEEPLENKAVESPSSQASWAIKGSMDDFQEIVGHGTVDEVLICLPVEEQFSNIAKIVRAAKELGVVVRLLPDAEDALLLKKLHLESFDGEYVITMFREQLLVQLLIKRLADLLISALLLVVLSPLLLIVGIAVVTTSPGPVFFVQERVGMNKRRFRLYKFRSMVVDAETRKSALAHLNEMDGPVFKVKNDPRITKVGKFIRRTSIDELPQLYNVLKGEMSLVGPRPPLPGEVDKYDWLYRKRLSIKPGLTCLWQISGRNEVSFQDWMAMDREYIENWSLWLDCKILAKTVPVVLLGKGAS
ncbi:MAG TPA: sugar transferase [Verrucomicrobiae bacterium]|nr:sugar transferase [Verrucomicrobiae bacterium]